MNDLVVILQIYEAGVYKIHPTATDLDQRLVLLRIQGSPTLELKSHLEEKRLRV
jgi:hypothetical protein